LQAFPMYIQNRWEHVVLQARITQQLQLEIAT
jgi:hypothetical protein